MIKSFVAYNLDKEFNVNLITNEVLEDNQFIPCGDYDLSKTGFSAWDDLIKEESESPFLRNISGYLMFKLKTQSKKLPSKKEMKRLVDKKLKKLDKSRNSLSDDALVIIENEVLQECLPTRDIKENEVVFIINMLDLTTFVSSNHKVAEEAIDHLRFTLNGFPVTPVSSQVEEDRLSSTLTRMVAEGYSDVLTLSDKVKLAQPKSEGKARHSVTGHSLYDADLSKQFAEGLKVKEVGLMDDGGELFTLNTSFEFKQLKLEKNKEASVESNLFLTAKGITSILSNSLKLVTN